jgi:hypothetical protein
LIAWRLESKLHILPKDFLQDFVQIPSHIPDFVEVIEKECFYLCTEFKVVEIPNSMSRIGDKCFFCCSSLLELQGF